MKRGRTHEAPERLEACRRDWSCAAIAVIMLGCEQNRAGRRRGNGGNARISQSKRIQQALCPRSEREFGNSIFAILRETSFECTDTGVYFMCQDMKGNSFLLYGDHGSRYAGEACGRATATIWARTATHIFHKVGRAFGYYDGYIYVTIIGGGAKLFRLNLWIGRIRPSKSDGFQE